MKRSKQSFKLYLEFLCELFIVASALIAILGVLMISLFVLISGIPPLLKLNFFSFIGGTIWKPSANPPCYGILPFIAGTSLVTVGALVIAVPIGVSSGIFLSEISRGFLTRLICCVTELLAAIPSVVYGFFGNIFVAPFVQQLFPNAENVGYNALSAMLILSVILLPLIINMTYISLRAVSQQLKHTSYALGATRWQTIQKVLLPAARSGIIAGIVLALGRAIGETMAVLMVAGGSPLMPHSIFSPIRTLTGAIAMDMGYASGQHRAILFSICSFLFFVVLIIGYMKNLIIKKLSFET